MSLLLGVRVGVSCTLATVLLWVIVVWLVVCFLAGVLRPGLRETRCRDEDRAGDLDLDLDLERRLDGDLDGDRLLNEDTVCKKYIIINLSTYF